MQSPGGVSSSSSEHSASDGSVNCSDDFKDPVKSQSFEKVFDVIKQYGRYQFLTFLLVQYIMLNSAGNYLFVSFATLKPECEIGEVNQIPDVCSRIDQCPLNRTRSPFYSLYQDNGFVCPHSYLPNHMQTLQAVGSGIGALLGGHLADSYGRKWITNSGAFLMTLFGFVGGFSPNAILLFVAMFGMGLAYGILIDALMTLTTEQVGPKYRIIQTLAFQWTVSMQVAALIAWLVRDWRKYLLLINGVCSPVLLLMYLFWVESPRWLIQKRRYSEAAMALNRIAWWNRVNERFDETKLKNMNVKSEKKEQTYTFADLFAHKHLFSYSIVMILSALTVELCGGVIIFDIQILAGDPFLNMVLYGVLRLWTPFFIVFVETHSSSVGRRSLFLYSQAFSIICYLGVIVFGLVPNVYSAKIIRTVLAMSGAMVNSSIFFTAYKQYSMELYPTLMRAIAVGTFGVVERIGGGLAPQLVSLNSFAWSDAALCITTVIMAASWLAGLAVLPETKNEDIPDVVEDRENGSVM
ncbi:unnamed protein product [Bursaphelenchus xylophilus]|uniref:(pine wood nematode) hypothetical protein n=1 Tax=Bursaphelenchus xylophilus TaxID=6326 RepID=A0A1I7RK52_BURXY|nr:unnamed protein product [Bursaphelenchus xylophilus]CAG9131503.1 unnamed protein product [Bursaphelenchus xylophilus]